MKVIYAELLLGQSTETEMCLYMLQSLANYAEQRCDFYRNL